MSVHYLRETARSGRVEPGIMLASGHARPDRKRYVWRDPAGGRERAALAAAILAAVGPEEDAWDMKLPKPAPGSRKWPAWRLQGCGTPAAYQRHMRRGERACQACADANNRDQARRKAERITEGTWRRAL